MPLQTALQNPEFLRPSSIVSMLRVMEMLKDIVGARLAIYGPDISQLRNITPPSGRVLQASTSRLRAAAAIACARAHRHIRSATRRLRSRDDRAPQYRSDWSRWRGRPPAPLWAYRGAPPARHNLSSCLPGLSLARSRPCAGTACRRRAIRLRSSNRDHHRNIRSVPPWYDPARVRLSEPPRRTAAATAVSGAAHNPPIPA